MRQVNEALRAKGNAGGDHDIEALHTFQSVCGRGRFEFRLHETSPLLAHHKKARFSGHLKSAIGVPFMSSAMQAAGKFLQAPGRAPSLGAIRFLQKL